MQNVVCFVFKLRSCLFPVSHFIQFLKSNDIFLWILPASALYLEFFKPLFPLAVGFIIFPVNYIYFISFSIATLHVSFLNWHLFVSPIIRLKTETTTKYAFIVPATLVCSHYTLTICAVRLQCRLFIFGVHSCGPNVRQPKSQLLYYAVQDNIYPRQNNLRNVTVIYFYKMFEIRRSQCGIDSKLD